MADYASNTDVAASQAKAGVEQAHGKANRFAGSGFMDNRTQSIVQRRLFDLADNSAQAKRIQAFSAMAQNSKQTTQLQAGMVAMNASVRQAGYGGEPIHVAAGQEQHLPHEAWHVVRQAQGRVKPTMQMAGGELAGVNSEPDTTAQLKPVLGEVTWGVTHAVKEENGSIYGDGGYAAGEIGPWGELTFGEIVTLDDDDLFMSRRGANQEDGDKRGKDSLAQPTVEWIRVLKIKGVDVTGLNVYVRSETVHVGDDVVDPGARWPKVNVEDVAWDDEPMLEGVRKIGEEYEEITKTRPEKETERNICSTEEMDQIDEGADVAKEFQIEEYRNLNDYEQAQTKVAKTQGETLIGVMQITVGKDETEERFLYIKWLLGSKTVKGGGVALIRSALEYAIANKITKIKVESAMSAVEWYQSRGFTKTGNAQHMNDDPYAQEKIDCGCAEMELQFRWSE